MTSFTILLDAATAELYRRIAARAGLPAEQVLSDALFQLAGQLSMEALRRKES